MIREVEEAILESLRKELSEYVPKENIIIGELDQTRTKSISLINTGFTTQELGIGSSGGVKKKEFIEKFTTDGKKKEFKLHQKALQPLISVESPPGTQKTEPDDYSLNYTENKIIFQLPPEKGKNKVQIKFSRAVAEIRNFKFTLNYTLKIWAENLLEKNQITLEAIKVLYSERAALMDQGIDEIKLIRGYSEKMPEEAKKVNIIEYQVETTIQIEIQLPSIDMIEIDKMDK